jgi:hypothetical protein
MKDINYIIFLTLCFNATYLLARLKNLEKILVIVKDEIDSR